MLHFIPTPTRVALTPQEVFETFLTCGQHWIEENAPSFEQSDGQSPYSDAQNLIDAILCDTLESQDPGSRLREHLDHVRDSLRVLRTLVKGFDNFEVGALAILGKLNDSAGLS